MKRKDSGYSVEYLGDVTRFTPIEQRHYMVQGLREPKAFLRISASELDGLVEAVRNFETLDLHFCPRLAQHVTIGHVPVLLTANVQDEYCYLAFPGVTLHYLRNEFVKAIRLLEKEDERFGSGT